MSMAQLDGGDKEDNDSVQGQAMWDGAMGMEGTKTHSAGSDWRGGQAAESKPRC